MKTVRISCDSYNWAHPLQQGRGLPRISLNGMINCRLEGIGYDDEQTWEMKRDNLVNKYGFGECWPYLV